MSSESKIPSMDNSEMKTQKKQNLRVKTRKYLMTILCFLGVSMLVDRSV